MELKDTVELMTSGDYKDRFKAEYYQLQIRAKKLHDIIIKQEAGTLEFELKCPINVLHEQLNEMERYKWLMELRAEHEKIEL